MAVIVAENFNDDCANGAQSPRHLLLKLYTQTSEACFRKTKQLKYAK